jgi:hypothetical protein
MAAPSGQRRGGARRGGGGGNSFSSRNQRSQKQRPLTEGERKEATARLFHHTNCYLNFPRTNLAAISGPFIASLFSERRLGE